MSTEENIIIGVVSGIITSALLFLLIQAFNKILLPWYRHAIYRSLDISGEWESVQNHELAEDVLILNLAQKEQHLKGTLTIIKTLKNGSAEKQIKNLAIYGYFHDGHLMLTGNNTDRRFRSHMTYLANIQSGGEQLHGIFCWVDSGHGQISSVETVYTRKSLTSH